MSNQERPGLPAVWGDLRMRLDGSLVLVNSREVADAFEKQHGHVLRDIDLIIAQTHDPDLERAWFRDVMLADTNGRDRRSVDMTKDGFSLLVMGYSGEKAHRFKVRYIQAFNALEHAVRSQQATLLDMHGTILGELLRSIVPDEERVRAIIREEIGNGVKLHVPEAVEYSVKLHVPIPRAEFSPVTRRMILSEWLRQNPEGLDPTGLVRIFGENKELLTDIADVHHMRGNHDIGFRDGLPVTKAFHRKLTADRERKGDEWRRAINAHKHFLDKHDNSQVTLFDMLRLVK